LLDDRLWNTSMLISFDQAEQVFAEDLKDHADMATVGTVMTEIIDETDDVVTTSVGGRRCDYSLKKLNLVECGFGVVTVRLDHF